MFNASLIKRLTIAAAVSVALIALTWRGNL